MRLTPSLAIVPLAVFTPCLLGFGQEARGTPAAAPNIVFILADDLGYGDLGAYGQATIQTPRIDRLAREGMRFTQFYAGSTVCAPSRCVLMTGRHIGRARVRGNARVPLEPEDVTVAEVLEGAGYTNALIGKWGLGEAGSTGVPTRQGFESFYGYLNQRHAHNYYPEFLWRNEEKVLLEGNVVEPARKGDDDGSGVAIERAQYSHDLFTEEALTFIDRHKDQRFFLYLAYTIPHANNEAGKKGMEVPDLGIYAEKDWPEPQKAHAAMVTRLDRDVGRILERLKAHGIDERTIVFFSSDNGPHREGGADPDFFRSSGPLRGIKRDLYEGGIRVPLIVRWPGRIAPGTTSDAIGGFQDFLATAAELAGAKDPGGHDGISLVPALLGKERKDPEFLYWEFYERGFSQAVRMGRHKGVRHGAGGPIELYDLAADLGETKDIAREHPEVAARLAAAMKEAHTPSPHWKAPEERTAR